MRRPFYIENVNWTDDNMMKYVDKVALNMDEMLSSLQYIYPGEIVTIYLFYIHDEDSQTHKWQYIWWKNYMAMRCFCLRKSLFDYIFGLWIVQWDNIHKWSVPASTKLIANLLLLFIMLPVIFSSFILKRYKNKSNFDIAHTCMNKKKLQAWILHVYAYARTDTQVYTKTYIIQEQIHKCTQKHILYKNRYTSVHKNIYYTRIDTQVYTKTDQNDSHPLLTPDKHSCLLDS